MTTPAPAPVPAPTKTKTYRGNCHCGAYVYDVELAADLEGGNGGKNASECNCTVCYKKGAIWGMPAAPRFLRGDPDALSTYSFGRRMYEHKFCPTCGVSLMIICYAEPEKGGEKTEIGVDLRSIQHSQLDIWNLDTSIFDGASLPPAYQPPEYTGPEPTAEIEGAKLYTGSCHCGAVRVALKSKPLDKTYDESILDCSCSHCRKAGVTWIYPLKEQVVITGVENQVRYTFNTRTWAKAFCRTCGVLVDNHLADVPAEHLAALSEPVRAFVLANAHRHPINLRVLHGVHRDDVNVARIDGFARPPIYEEP